MDKLDAQIESLTKERNQFEAEVIALKCANKSMRVAIDDEFENGKPIDLVWMTRDEMKEYSDINQAGGVDAIKADAIDIALSLIIHVSDGDVCFDILTNHIQELRDNNG